MYYYFGTAGYRDFQYGRYGNPYGKKARDRRAWQLAYYAEGATEKQIDQIAQRTDVAAVSHYDALNVDLSADYTIQGKTCVIAGGDHSILTEIYEDLTEGQYPVKENEILLSNGAKELLSVNIGDVITMHTPAGDFDYRISGFGGDVTITTDADVVGTFLSWDSFQSLAKAEESSLSRYVLYALMKILIFAGRFQSCGRPMDLLMKYYRKIRLCWE